MVAGIAARQLSVFEFRHLSKISHMRDISKGVFANSSKVHMVNTSVADQDPGSGAFLNPGSGIRDG